MNYFVIPMTPDGLDMDHNFMIQSIDIGNSLYIVKVKDGAVTRSTWKVKTQSDWDTYTAPTLSQVKQSKIAELQNDYIASFTTFQSSALGTVKTYPIDTEAQENLKELQDRLIADANKTVFYFKTIEDGTLVSHTRAQFLQLMADAEAFKVSKAQKYDGYANQVTAAADIPTVQAIVWA